MAWVPAGSLQFSSSSEKWNQLWYIHPVECHSIPLLIHAITWTNLQRSRLSGRRQMVTCCVIPFIWHSFFIFIYFFGCTMWLVGSYFPDQGLNPDAQQWKHWVLTTGLPENSPYGILEMTKITETQNTWVDVSSWGGNEGSRCSHRRAAWGSLWWGKHSVSWLL